jgi:gliding motility-associated-like protein
VDDGSCEYPVDPCDNEEVLVPNAFTPNNDGLNDEWYPVTNADCWKYWSVKIFNRWGQLIWETDKADDRWDGTVKDSDNCVSDGVYVYIIVGERYNADIFQKTGHITVFK